jgi:hypothetical protein
MPDSSQSAEADFVATAVDLSWDFNPGAYLTAINPVASRASTSAQSSPSQAAP